MADAAFQADWFSKPGDTLSALMARRALSAGMVAERMGCDTSLVHGLLAGTAAIDEDIAALLAASVGGSVSFWKARQSQFERMLETAATSAPRDEIKAWLKAIPLKNMADAGWIKKPADTHEATKTTLSFFDVVSPQEWYERYTSFGNSFSFRTSPAYESKLGAVAAWLRQGELQAAMVPCARWDADTFRSSLEAVRKLTRAKEPAYFLPRLQSICARAGVAVVIVRAPSGCRASGATRFISPDKAMIILSFRHLSDDHFWFTFFHEAGHLLLHGPEHTYVDGDESENTEKETEADAFSAGVLIPPERTEAMADLRARSEEIMRFAVSLSIAPGIVVGQLQKMGMLDYKQFSWLKRRYTWEQIERALDHPKK
ncbi:ImmA/IrrE family metallo-endopeptidase [Methylobacterium oxalidis]|uniref:XRE family transcriptional regulator n=1 Tax=Methylobacterium oxalidis TaxID=944322 RepID=A0A512IX27_9HYPH|nr:ImmA/IrrE family metallo-endopeptidase [Methylobacterium oxalidis]GEP02262.1 XRE family transcriptional regulator [Methylobacterium oxalidis]GJE32252.1 hypothetical protein LDDCCGHA_2438 [Methylobacterium oxalidis]GLS62207.1 XRE family transcriptional regulator [Methylobacterium oxalidis]